MDIVVVGVGHTGKRVLELAREDDQPARGLTRDPQKASALRAEGFDVRVADAEDPASLGGRFPPGCAVVYTAPPVIGPGERDLGVDNVVAAAAGAKALIYLSTTGVYTERGGAVVTEESPVDPDEPRSAPRLHAEASLLGAAKARGITGVVLRLAGIYGRGRGLAERLAEGRVFLWGGGDNLLNRIHVDDVARFCIAAAWVPAERSGVYNLADDRPASLREYALWLCERLGLPEPPEAPLEEAPSRTLLGSKQVSNLKAKLAFGLTLRHPSYEEGFAADARAGFTPGARP